jgi:hypothetical protein
MKDIKFYTDLRTSTDLLKFPSEKGSGVLGGVLLPLVA